MILVKKQSWKNQEYTSLLYSCIAKVTLKQPVDMDVRPQPYYYIHMLYNIILLSIHQDTYAQRSPGFVQSSVKVHLHLVPMCSGLQKSLV